MTAVAPGGEGAFGETNVLLTILHGSQEVEHGAVVPDVELADVFNRSHVADDPLHLGSAVTEATFRHGQARFGDVEHGYPPETQGQQVVN